MVCLSNLRPHPLHHAYVGQQLHLGLSGGSGHPGIVPLHGQLPQDCGLVTWAWWGLSFNRQTQASPFNGQWLTASYKVSEGNPRVINAIATQEACLGPGPEVSPPLRSSSVDRLRACSERSPAACCVWPHSVGFSVAQCILPARSYVPCGCLVHSYVL